MSKPRSRIAKGRRFQKTVCEKIAECFDLNIPDDIRTPVGSETGLDIKPISTKAKDMLNIGVECKDQERLSLWESLRQCVNNAGALVPALIFKRGGKVDNKRTWICVPLDHYLDIRKELLKNKN